MPVFEAETHVDAPLDEVWDFHSRIDGLIDLTPDWMGMSIGDVVGPDGEPDPGILEEGSRVDVSLKPFGVIPGFSWTSVILERGRTEETAEFKDEMVEGPFKKWVHTHSFEATNDGTVVRDRVEFELPLWMLGRFGSPFFRLNAGRMFSQRHKKTKEILENPDRGDGSGT